METFSVKSVGGNLANEHGEVPLNELNSSNLKLTQYPNSRNDGQLTSNKILTTDVQGFVKLCTIAVAPAPFLEVIESISFLPLYTGNFVFKGAFFTPTMTVEVEGQTINSVTFKSDNEIIVNLTLGSVEGKFDVKLNNGILSNYTDFLMIVLGEIIIPKESDYIVYSGNPNLSVDGEFRTSTISNVCVADFFTIPVGQNFRVMVTFTNSPLSNTPITVGPVVPAFSLFSNVNNTEKYAMKVYLNGVGRDNSFYAYQASTGFEFTGQNVISGGRTATFYDNPTFYFERIGTEMKIKWDNATNAFSDISNEELKIRIYAGWFDSINIKYIKLQ